MKVLFIGGTGNISTACTRLALQKGIDMYLFTRGQKAIPDGAHSITGNVNEKEDTQKLLADYSFDVVVNWVVHSPAQIERDIELFKGKTKQYIFISSASAYQKPPAHYIITESTPLCNPYWEYSRNKIACENRLMEAYRNEGFPATIVRPSLTYDTVIPLPIGGWGEYTVIDRIKKGKKVIVHGDGTAIFTITHSEDFAKGFVGLLGHQQAVGHSFHITSDEVLSWDQIYQAAAAAVGKEAEIIHIPSDFIVKFDDSQAGNLLGDKAVSVVFDNTKIKRFVPEFKAVIPFKEGIRRTIEWFEADKNRMVVNEDTNKLIDRIIAAYEKALFRKL